MTNATILEIPDVDIDPTGVFKYILVKVVAPNPVDTNANKIIVRGYADCSYHSDINDKVTEELQKLKKSGKLPDWRTKVLGGGRINHDADAKAIKVYGYSQGYGQGDHQVTVSILKKYYTDYDITYSNEGY